MRFSRVFLANLISHETSLFRQRAVLRAGMGYVAQALEDAGVACAVDDMALGFGFGRLRRKIRDFGPDAIGISMFTYRYAEAYAAVARLKKEFGVPIIVGGPHASVFREKLLEECPSADFCMAREGERSIVKLCRGEDFSKIEGLIYRENSAVRSGPPAIFIDDLDALSFPRYRAFERQNYPLRDSPVSRRVIPLVTSRGCPYECVYCPVNAAIGRKLRCRGADSVVGEISHWRAAGYRNFSVVDDNFTLVKDRVYKICEGIKRAGFGDITLGLPNGIRADKTDRQMLETMYDAGFRYVGIGVESGCDAVLKSLKKSESTAVIDEAIKNAVEIGYYVDLYFLIGSPGETERDVMASIELAAKYPVDKAHYFNLIPYPGTELFDTVTKTGRFLYPPEYYLNNIHSNMNVPVFETKEFPAAARARMLKHAKRAERLRKKELYRRRLTSKGLPGFAARAVSSVYSYEPVRVILNDSELLAAIKKRMMK